MTSRVVNCFDRSWHVQADLKRRDSEGGGIDTFSARCVWYLQLVHR
jgi:hypothetical protein